MVDKLQGEKGTGQYSAFGDGARVAEGDARQSDGQSGHAAEQGALG